jgi:hypothetical protein
MEIGGVVMLGEAPQRGCAPHYAEVRDFALQAGQAGFDSLWFWDHLLYRQPDQPQRGQWECWTILSALADATTRIELGTFVICATFRNPAVLAKMAATLDEVGDGRFTLGLGAGWNEPEFAALGLPFEYRVDRFEEALRIIEPLVREGQVDFHGTYDQAPNCAIAPRGPRPIGPPILIAANGPRMQRLAARHAASWNGVDLVRPADLDAPRAAPGAACAEVGCDPATLAMTVGLSVAYPDLATPPRPLDTDFRGSTAAIAATLGSFAERGVAQLMCRCAPSNGTALAARRTRCARSGRGTRRERPVQFRLQQHRWGQRPWGVRAVRGRCHRHGVLPRRHTPLQRDARPARGRPRPRHRLRSGRRRARLGPYRRAKRPGGRRGRQRGADRADPLLTAFHIGDARRLDFVDDTFDGCRTDRVLQHLDLPGRAIGEPVRVAKPGGRIVAVEPNRETLLVDAPNRDVTRKILHVRCDAVRNGWTGRPLPRLFKPRGLTDIRVVPLPSVRTAYEQTVASLRLGYYAQQAREAGIVTAAEAAAWTGALEETGKAGCFCCAVTLFRVAGRQC